MLGRRRTRRELTVREVLGVIVVSVDVTISSRMQSIGGFVTCANSCLK